LKNFSFFLILFFYFFSFDDTFSNGDLTRQKAIKVEVFMKGSLGKIHYFEPSTLTFKTGNLYNLKIKNVSDSKHYFSSVRFANSIFTRKIQLVLNENKIAEIKGLISEIEIFPNHSLEWWFVPIKTGVFNDLHCRIKDKESKRSHSEMGMVGTIIIE
tara:strand:- start:557 stop:1027 length:471 start_codon:yes stop_codon:yes gene_type:complete